MVHSMSESLRDEYKKNFGTEVYLQKTNKKEKHGLSPKMIYSFVQSNYLTRKELTAKTGYVPENFSTLLDDGSRSSLKGYLIGSSRRDIDDNFKKGVYKIIDGKMYRNSNECIISKALADENQLKVGDLISLGGTNEKNIEAFNLKISGIYNDISMQGYTNMTDTSLTHPYNRIFTMLETVQNSELFQHMGILEAQMYLKDPSLLNAFKRELKSKGLPDSYKVFIDEIGYERIMEPIKNIAKISKNMIVGILLLGSGTLILLSLLSISERRYEIGVLRSMGMKKKCIVSGLLIEIWIVTSICLFFGIVISQPVTQLLTDLLLSSSIESIENAGMNLKLPKFNIVFLLQICTVSLFLASLASIGGIISIVRFEPIKILNDRKS